MLASWDKKFIKIGHRGAMGYEPENTFASFEKAIELRVDAVELDVHICKSGELVVIHDDTLERTTDGKGRVSNKTLVELKNLDAGSGEEIPTLEEVCHLVNHRVAINIELKGINTAFPVARLLDQLIKSGWQREEFLVSSLRLKEIDKFSTLQPEIKNALVFGKRYFRTSPSRFWRDVPLSVFNMINKVGAKTACVKFDYVSQVFAEEFNRRNLSLLVWSVNRPKDIHLMKRIGVDGIFSDFPDRLN